MTSAKLLACALALGCSTFTFAQPLPEGDTGIASKYPADKDIAKNPAVIFHEDFESLDWESRWDSVYHDPFTRIAEEPGNVHSGKRALEFRVPKQPEGVANEAVKTFEGRDTVFLRYYSRFDPGFDQLGSSHNGAFLCAIGPDIAYGSPGIPANGRNKFVAGFECWREFKETQKPGDLNVYCYHPAQRSQWGDHFFPDGKVLPNSSDKFDFGESFVSRPNVIPELGRWYCYEMMVHANTIGKKDGRIACWVDGKLIADFPNLHLRDVDSLKINHAVIVLHIGSNVIRENKKWNDDVVVATEYIGPRK